MAVLQKVSLKKYGSHLVKLPVHPSDTIKIVFFIFFIFSDGCVTFVNESKLSLWMSLVFHYGMCKCRLLCISLFAGNRHTGTCFSLKIVENRFRAYHYSTLVQILQQDRILGFELFSIALDTINCLVCQEKMLNLPPFMVHTSHAPAINGNQSQRLCFAVL